jgi:putative ABC transport system ATP-binding protein
MIRVRDLVMRLPGNGRPVTILDGVSLEVAAGEVVAVTGPSGSGKSTLLGLIAGLDTPSAGSIAVDGLELTGLGETQLARFRRRTLGFVFQSYHLIATLTAAENVAVPLELAGAPEPMTAARNRLAEVGLAERADHYPAQLSGGEQQRVAIARAFANRPGILLADEPTGNLDTANGSKIFDLLVNLNHQRGTTLMLVTHEPLLAAAADRQIVLNAGRIVSDVSRAVSRGAP